jgi:hypothetical protein
MRYVVMSLVVFALGGCACGCWGKKEASPATRPGTVLEPAGSSGASMATVGR